MNCKHEIWEIEETAAAATDRMCPLCLTDMVRTQAAEIERLRAAGMLACETAVELRAELKRLRAQPDERTARLIRMCRHLATNQQLIADCDEWLRARIRSASLPE